MEPDDVAELVESALPEATCEVSKPRGVEDDDHLALTVVSPAFEGKSLVEQHQLVHDALAEHLTRDIHAIELETYAPGER